MHAKLFWIYMGEDIDGKCHRHLPASRSNAFGCEEGGMLDARRLRTTGEIGVGSPPPVPE